MECVAVRVEDVLLRGSHFGDVVGFEGLVGGRGAGGEGLGVEFGDGVVADEFAGLVL